ncbi:MAG: sigma-54-dependent Fis family transcriptional regulator, partial [Ignavibacteriae bacterium]|nr:sigma-54-dependent Fis family transcriptional regulator [Ignavibacteriota bacterium]
KSILIIDDEKEICESLKMILEYEDYEVESSTDVELGLKKLEYNNYDALLLDIQMPKMTGFEVLKWISENEIQLSTIMISAHGNLENAIKATKLGAFDFIEKPIDRDKLLISIRNAVDKTKLIKENKKLSNNLIEDQLIIGESPEIKTVTSLIERVAKTDSRVLITGENGTGKELVAKAIHNKSERAERELIEVNCAAIPNELIESELFGHEKGSFTGAAQKRIGKFEQANGSTLFLDEIGDMSLHAQAKVLRAIEEGVIERVGGNNKIEVDVRILSATNKDLKSEISNGNFREDLYHRLNVIPIKVPPLRERKSDIPILISHFTKKICNQNKFPQKKFENDAIEVLTNYPWSGNVRELRNIIERIIIMIASDNITKQDVNSMLPVSEQKSNDFIDISNSFQEFKEKAEKAFIQKQLEINKWNISKTADILGIQRSHLYNKIKKYNIEKG